MSWKKFVKEMNQKPSVLLYQEGCHEVRQGVRVSFELYVHGSQNMRVVLLNLCVIS